MEAEQDRSSTASQQQPGPDLSLSLNGARSGRHTDQPHVQSIPAIHAVGMPSGSVWHDHASSSSLTDYNGYTVVNDCVRTVPPPVLTISGSELPANQ